MIRQISTILAAYLIGAIPFGVIVAKLYGISDLRSVGSGNIGATNVYRAAGLKAALWVYALDVGKGVLVVLAATFVKPDFISQNELLAAVAVAAVLGHIFPVYVGFRGGKGVATALGTLLVIIPIETLIALGAFLITVLPTRVISLGSLVAALVLPGALFVERFAMNRAVPDVFLVLATLITLIVILTHLRNIKRLLKGQEHSLQSQHSKAKANSHV